jgi:hypothetical protein
MAKIHEEIVVIKLSKLVKDSDNIAPIATASPAKSDDTTGNLRILFVDFILQM